MKKLMLSLLVLLMLIGCNQPQARRPINIKTGSHINKSIQINKKLNSEQHERIKQIIQKNPDTKFIASQNGFWYYYNLKIENDSIMPNFGDIVSFNYTISDFDGNTIYTEKELKTQNYSIDQEELFSGLRQGLKLMKVGETVSFLFPSHKAYGYYGDENKIGINTPIICKVTLNSITQNKSK